jgi:ornithine--oxo-acid transaminase
MNQNIKNLPNIYKVYQNLTITRAKDCILYTKNNKYIDLLGGFGAVIYGHCNKNILKALNSQSKKLNLTGRLYNNDVIEKWSKKITTKFNYDSVLPLNTGTEAVESAIALSFKYGFNVLKQKKPKIVVFNNSFHGRTMGSVSATFSNDFYRKDRCVSNHFINIEYNNIEAVKNLFKNKSLELDIQSSKSGNLDLEFEICSILIEPIQGEGGINKPSDKYLIELHKICKENNVLLIFDEIQTGMGRTGKYLASNHLNIKPDVTILGKGLGGGIFPISCILSSHNLMNLFTLGSYGSTFGGNPLACAISIESLNMLDYYIENINRKYEYIYSLNDKIRGRGLMLGLHSNNSNIINDMMDNGILSATTKNNIVRITPPYTITKKQIDYCIKTLNF